MSNQDSQFINRFSAILGTLVVVSIALVFLSRAITAATPTEDEPATAAPAQAQVASVTGASAAGTAQPQPASASDDGAAVYQQVCSVCHAQGIAGAPKFGDATAWGPRIAQGKTTLYDHALRGFNGKTGVMPPKAGRGDLSDAAVQAAVDYIVSKSGG